jgi:hypothetical protein
MQEDDELHKGRVRRLLEKGSLSGEVQVSQATIEQPLIDINVVGYQLPEASAKLRQIASGVKSFKQTDAVQNLQAFGLGQFVQRNECLALPTTKK